MQGEGTPPLLSQRFPQASPGLGLWRSEAWCLVLLKAGVGRLGRVGALEEVWEPRERPTLREALGPAFFPWGLRGVWKGQHEAEKDGRCVAHPALCPSA